MAEYHLDTNICAAALEGDPKVQGQILAHFGALRVDAIVVGELYTGVYRSSRVDENLEALEDFLSGLEIIPYGEDAARAYGRITADLIT